MTDFFEESLELHRRHRGKMGIAPKVPLNTRNDLSLAYTPGVAGPCKAIAADSTHAYELTRKGNCVAVLSDGSAVLGLGDIGPYAALPVMEGKAILFKEFAGIDAVPLCVAAKTDEEMIAVARSLVPTFGGINLEDIRAPRCFVVEDALQDAGIPVLHDDQHGTAIVLLAALTNAAKLIGKQLEHMRVIISGAGAAGTAIAKILRCVNFDPDTCVPVRDVLVCDSRGVVSADRPDLSAEKREILKYSNRDNVRGALKDALVGADAFIGVSRGGILSADDIRSMADDSVILAMANPIPEIMPDVAIGAGAAVVGTGRSDFPNQVNNVLAFPGLFRGALDARASRFTQHMKLAAVHALAQCAGEIAPDRILPDPLDRTVAPRVADAVRQAALGER